MDKQRDVTGDRPVETPAAQPAAPAAPEREPRTPAADTRTTDPTTDPTTDRSATDRSTTDPGTTEAPPQARTEARAEGTPERAPAEDTSIWDAAKSDELRGRWHEVQTRFVDDPKSSVSSARALVDEAMHGLEESVRDREEAVERSGARAADSTEGMRDAVQQYHRLLDRLLSV